MAETARPDAWAGPYHRRLERSGPAVREGVLSLPWCRPPPCRCRPEAHTMKNSDRLRCEAARVRRLREAGLGDALAATVVEEDAVLLAGPDRIGAQETPPLDLEEQAAPPIAAR